jgi:biopolymer transport protein ExbB/TolQ
MTALWLFVLSVVLVSVVQGSWYVWPILFCVILVGLRFREILADGFRFKTEPDAAKLKAAERKTQDLKKRAARLSSRFRKLDRLHQQVCRDRELELSELERRLSPRPPHSHNGH